MTVVVGELLHDLERRAGHDVAGFDAVDIDGDVDDAVRVVAGEVGVDAADGDGVRLLLRCARAAQQGGAYPGETVGLNDRHCSSFRCDVRAAPRSAGLNYAFSLATARRARSVIVSQLPALMSAAGASQEPPTETTLG